MDVHPGDLLLYGPQVLAVAFAGELAVDAALPAHLGGTLLPGLAGAPRDLCGVEEVRIAAQVQGLGAFGERAEAAPEVALVGVVAVDDLGNLVAVHRAPELVRDTTQLGEFRTSSGEEQGYLLLGQVSLSRSG